MDSFKPRERNLGMDGSEPAGECENPYIVIEKNTQEFIDDNDDDGNDNDDNDYYYVQILDISVWSSLFGVQTGNF